MTAGEAVVPTRVTLAAATSRPIHGPWRSAWHSLLGSKLAVFGLVVLAILVLVALFADVLAPYSYTAQDVPNARRGPSAAH